MRANRDVDAMRAASRLPAGGCQPGGEQTGDCSQTHTGYRKIARDGRPHTRNRSGHHRHHSFRHRRARKDSRPRLWRDSPVLPEAGMGRARSRGDLSVGGHAREEGAEGGARAVSGCRGNRHHQSARDLRGVGAQVRTPGLSRDRVAMPPQRGNLPSARGSRKRGIGAHRLAPRSVFFRHQAQMAAGREARTAQTRGARRAMLRDHRYVADFQTFWWGRVRDRLHQRLAHDAVQP